MIWIILYFLMFLTAWALFGIAGKRSGGDWKAFLKSRFHNAATVLIYVSIGVGLLFFPRRMAVWLPDVGPALAEFVGVVVDLAISLLVLFVLTAVYKRKIRGRGQRS